MAAGLFLLLSGAAPAAAHAELVATVPAAGAVLDRAPRTVAVQFSESVGAVADGLRVLGPDGARVDTGNAAEAPGRPGTLVVPLRSGLGDGAYVVSWRAVPTDSHPVHGAFGFTVGPVDGTTPAAAPPRDADRDSDPLLGGVVSVAHGVGYAGLALLTGAIGILLLLPDGPGRTGVRRLAVNGGLILVAAGCTGLLAQGPYAAGAGPGALLDPALLRPTLTDRPGLTTGARIVLVALLLVAVHRNQPRPAASRQAAPGPSLLVAAVLGALAATFAASGHAATGRWVPLALTVDVLHLLAMGLWLGGLAVLVGLYARRDRPDVLARVTRRFSTVAGWCVTVLVVTGVVQAYRRLGSPATIFTTDYGRLLTAKVLVIALLLLTARRARRWTRTHTRTPVAVTTAPRTKDRTPAPASVAPAPASAPDPAPAVPAAAFVPAPAAHGGAPAGRAMGERGEMRRTLLAETVIGAVVIALSTLLAGTSAPHGADVDAGPAVRPAVAAPVRPGGQDRFIGWQPPPRPRRTEAGSALDLAPELVPRELAVRIGVGRVDHGLGHGLGGVEVAQFGHDLLVLGRGDQPVLVEVVPVERPPGRLDVRHVTRPFRQFFRPGGPPGRKWYLNDTQSAPGSARADAPMPLDDMLTARRAASLAPPAGRRSNAARSAPSSRPLTGHGLVLRHPAEPACQARISRRP
jgi:copper transport protein